ncbi:hypothetical protein HK102_007289 [Quaeritorhiza haematococci]|nr:hypothetical protein HK102_007289 [Quaeritorhiza haematococci]
MGSRVFVGGLAWETNDQSLRARFEEFGDIETCQVIVDRETGRSKGFGFVTFTEPASAKSAIEGVNDQELDGRVIHVEMAQEKKSGDGPRGDRFGGRRSGGYGGGARGGDRRYESSGGDSYRRSGGSSGGGRYGDRDRRGGGGGRSGPYDRPSGGSGGRYNGSSSRQSRDY